MPYTSAFLTTFYSNIHAGLAPSGAAQALINAYAAQNNAGTLSDAATIQAIIDTADGDSAVAIGSYQYFTGTAPSAAGLAYLVNSTANPTDLNDPYYQNFNQTNRFINFAANLGTGAGAGAAAFKTAYGPLTTAQTVDIAYEAIVGTTNAQAAGIDVTAAKAYINSQLPYFTALANQNAPGASAADKDLMIKAEIVGYIMSAAVAANVGTYSNAISALLADLGPDNTANLGADLLANYASTVVTLTIQPETKVANVFNAPRGFTPGGTDQVNTLNDDDNLTGVGTNPTLNFTFVTDADTGDQYILPTMTNVQTVNVAFASDFPSQLDLEDSTGVKAVNITRISGNAPLAGVVNMTSIPTLSIANSQAPTGNVALTFLQSTVAGAADATTLTLSNVNIGGRLYIQQTGPSVVAQNVGLTDGIETLTIVSTGSANTVGVLEAEDLKSLVITGGQKLTLGATGLVVNAAAGGLIEATDYLPGLANVAGSLTSIDASAMTASLDISVGAEATSTLDDTSGTPVNISIKTGSANDTIRLLGGLDGAGDVVDGGAGTDTVQLFNNLTKGSVTNVEGLDIRSGHVANAIAVDTSLFPQLATITLRNEGNTNVPPAVSAPAAAAASFTLTKLTPTTAGAITILHGTTGNNNLAGNTIVATLATDTANDTVGVTIKDGVNANPRFNFTLTAGTGIAPTANPVENVTINDSDTESNTVALTNVASHTGTLTLNGGLAGTFLNLDSAATGFDALLGATRKDVSGGAADGKGWVDFGAGAGDWVVASTVAAGGEASDVIIRVGNPAGAAGAQSITTGSGNDVVIFDAVGGTGQGTAGLSISDTVAAGAGTADVLVIDGNVSGAVTSISLSASEWTNVSGFEQLRLIGDGAANNNAAGALNAYNITLTNAFITANNTTTGGIQRIAIHNDNDPNNDVITGVNTYGADTANTGVESGVTIDARQLDATHSFSYNGEEGASRTPDRFIMSDANINGAAIIDGGAVYGGGNTVSNLANADVLEVRDAAVVTIGDLANVKNVGTLSFTNDTAAVQSSILQLDTTTIDNLVNSTEVAGAANPLGGTFGVETLAITVTGNTLVAGAATNLTIDATAVDFTKTTFTVTATGGSTSTTIIGAGTGGGTPALNFVGGAGADTVVGTNGNDTISGGAGNDVITPGNGADIVRGGPGADTINLTETVQSADQVLFAPGDGGTSVLTGTFAPFDTITGFNADFDTLRASGAGTAVVLNGVAAPQAAGVTFTNVAFNTFDLNGAVGGAFMTGTTTTDLTSGFDVSVNGIGGVANETVGEQAYFVVVVGAQVGLYHFVSDTADGNVGATELELLGVATYTGTLTAADIVFF